MAAHDLSPLLAMQHEMLGRISLSSSCPSISFVERSNKVFEGDHKQAGKMAALALIKGCIDVAINTKKAVDFFKTMGKSEEEAFYFWRMLDALTAPLELAIALRRRVWEEGEEGERANCASYCIPCAYWAGMVCHESSYWGLYWHQTKGNGKNASMEEIAWYFNLTVSKCSAAFDALSTGTVYFPSLSPAISYSSRMLFALLTVSGMQRHSTLHDVDAVVELARYTIARCELLVDRDGEGLPDDDSSGAWKEWLNGKKDGVSRLQIMRELLPKLQMTHQALTLALTSIRIKHDSDTLKIRSPFSFIPHATDVAVEVYHDFEFGRVESHIMIAMGEIYKSTQTPAAARAIRTPQQMKFASDLDSSKLDDSGVSEGEPTAHGDLSLSEDLSFARKWMDEVVIPELEVDESDKNRLVYKLGQEYLIAFESTANISAETFEAIICIGKCLQPSSRAQSRKPTCIADLSLDDRRWWKAQLEKQLGPFYEQESHEDVNSIIRWASVVTFEVLNKVCTVPSGNS
ncbi:hypothetical protein GUITHDRAFT_131484 [Guillardia theta CCMP2712]|uniref:Uncharacterized protein n=1 Tax=Guillardia theta (strain CCMP2712) TaxID=905079 RepID=L1K438_GUITC|nr:hypothetical protein GUITHDRAFT_131484 [Guillardia theta CCMP2712]EKX55235.1 hypothetical protein GUITHDRAFT_131484 [Guillardia theta CCMP2712]|eukprot:XP_005842215.1 hypothetical protein GUITHDRAFT_131484 [Guillardia theta CCMP2712]